MKVYFDSSSFCKRYIEEKGSQKVDDILLLTDVLGLSIVVIPEIISALVRRCREKSITSKQFQIAKLALLEDVKDAQIVNITNDVISLTNKCLETSLIKTLDALHIACATKWQAELFVSSDKQQIKAAKNCFLQTQFV